MSSTSVVACLKKPKGRNLATNSNSWGAKGQRIAPASILRTDTTRKGLKILQDSSPVCLSRWSRNTLKNLSVLCSWVLKTGWWEGLGKRSSIPQDIVEFISVVVMCEPQPPTSGVDIHTTDSINYWFAPFSFPMQSQSFSHNMLWSCE